jgi:hypothetical protein
MNTERLADRPPNTGANLLAEPACTVERVALATVEKWLEACREFLAWHRQNRMLRDVSPEVRPEADRAHAWLLRTARIMHGQMLDPDFPLPAMAQRVEGTVWQLQEAWSQAHNPLSEPEADCLIARYFPPDEPRA